MSLAAGWEVQATLSFHDLDRRADPSRFPVGLLHCDEAVASFATSDLAFGYEVDLDGLRIRRPLAGAPLNPLERQGSNAPKWALGTLHDGQAAWKTPDGRLIWSRLAGRSDVALVVEGAIHKGGDVLTSSGLGATARRIQNRLFWVRTGLAPWGGKDEVQLGVDAAPLGQPVEVPASVRATALGRFASGDSAAASSNGGPASVSDGWTLLMAWDQESQTSVQALRVVLP